MKTGVAKLYRSYGAWGLVRLTLDWVATKAVLPPARLMRRPFYLRGTRWMSIGKNFTTGPGLRLDAMSQNTLSRSVLRIGADVQFNDYVHIAATNCVSIGDRVLIASKVFITDHNHGRYAGPEPHDSPSVAPIDRPLSSAPVVIEEDVWIGEFVSVLPGVTIGRGAVVGTMSTVTRDIPAYCMAVGSPARVIKRYNFERVRWENV